MDRSAFDRIIQAGGFVSVSTGSAPDGNAIPVPKPDAELAMDAAACIGCGACVAACPNASAMLFTAAKVAQLALLPQGQPERYRARAQDGRGHGRGGLRQLHEPRRVRGGLPEGDQLDFIARMNRDFLKASLMGVEESRAAAGPGSRRRAGPAVRLPRVPARGRWMRLTVRGTAMRYRLRRLHAGLRDPAALPRRPRGASGAQGLRPAGAARPPSAPGGLAHPAADGAVARRPRGRDERADDAGDPTETEEA